MSAIPPIGAGFPPIPQATATASAARPRSNATQNAPSGLWDVLTDEERAYFLSVSALGPVSYGPSGASSAPAKAPTGQRVDCTA